MPGDLDVLARGNHEHPHGGRGILLYRARGLRREEAELLADRIMANKKVAPDTLAREELGLDPSALGSP